MREKTRTCKICGETFTYVSPWNKQTCSPHCHYQLVRQISAKNGAVCIEKKCKKCGVIFSGLRKYLSGGLCKKCRFEKMSEDRKGKGNPAYVHGMRGKGKPWGSITSKHLRACSKYRAEFLEKHGYIFCEVCRTNYSLKFEVHHIYFASKYPRHVELHNPKNLVMVCIQCHNDFHSSKKEKEFRKIERERGLKRLFEGK